jgi:hypothetical protein
LPATNHHLQVCQASPSPNLPRITIAKSATNHHRQVSIVIVSIVIVSIVIVSIVVVSIVKSPIAIAESTAIMKWGLMKHLPELPCTEKDADAGYSWLQKMWKDNSRTREKETSDQQVYNGSRIRSLSLRSLLP